MAPPASDPAVYQAHHDAFAAEGLPTSPAGWVERAQKVAGILAPDAATRNIEQKVPHAEVSLLKSSGLTKILGDPKYGGGGQTWEVAFRAIRELATGDGSVGMLLGYHLQWSSLTRVIGTEEQKERWEKTILETNSFVGAAVNPRDNDSRITPNGEGLVFNGFKNFTTGGALSDLIVLEGVHMETNDHIFTIVPTKQPGFQFAYNWHNMGMRLTESGSCKIEEIPFEWKDALGFDVEAKKPIKELLESPYETLLGPIFQLVFSNFYNGIARGALQTAKGYTTTTTRPWPFTHNPQKSALDEHYILAKYGRYLASIRAADALCDAAGKEISDLFHGYAGNKLDLTARQRGEVAESVTACKITSSHMALEVTGGVFEVTGARSTSEKYSFDRFWKDIRVHTLHDPLAYKENELGRYYLTNEIPTPSWYT
ncbi:thermophilic desulfurizing enzyme family protein [Aspergillus ruber CBS 135680]|uniref:Thermophilic desulfurizing enzyme family protein n=1 Tax=Aspergillus ruber (strain CBS 135680) TaxID=1388766 RepID=A0A017S442_ASPRC|nr:thermophilic desulfurizing enzyme family protein [Aspergillus ruber CBS 135680]EYE91576.1 thermophilic desulfurizing enzyme family protein [Aspergillus ruber CBS 135680]